MDHTYEEATRCPKCEEPGNARSKVPQGGGTTLHTVYCENTRCEWFNTPWLVQVNADGSVPAPRDHTGSAKVYKPNAGDEELARRVLEATMRDQDLSTQAGAEVNNPNGGSFYRG